MPRSLFVNLPVKNLKRTRDFFAALGFSFNPQFTDDNAACLVINDGTSVMLLQEAFFASFTPKKICDTRDTTEVLLALSLGSREEVDSLVAEAIAAGATEGHPPEDHGFMYSRAFLDLDGHNWGPFWMDDSQFPAR